MPYVTVRQHPQYHQMTLEEFLFSPNASNHLITDNKANTRTYFTKYINPQLTKKAKVDEAIRHLALFNAQTDPLRAKDRHELYYTFHIPKRSGGLRRIDAPEDELMGALRSLKSIFEKDFHVLYHTAAFAYVKQRCTIDAVKKHQQNGSKWFAKLDFHNFFGSTTPEFVYNMFSQIFPFSEVVKTRWGKNELTKALDLAFLDGGLPQGTPISPLITNVMMIPIDHKLMKAFREHDNNFVYTRYADDIIVSSKHDFDVHEVEEIVMGVLREFDAPFELNERKTRYGSSSGANWNLGVMLNKDNVITVGRKKKKAFETMVHNYLCDRTNGISWPLEDVQVMRGLYSYYSVVEPEAFANIIKFMDKKLNANWFELVRQDLAS